MLERHLNRDLDADRAGVREKDLRQRSGGQIDEPCAQGHGGLVCEPAEHHVGHPIQLITSRPQKLRRSIAVDGSPPRCHSVDQLPPVEELEAHAVRATDWVHGRSIDRRRVGVPYVCSVEG